MNPDTYLELLKKALTRYPILEHERELPVALAEMEGTLADEIQRCLLASRSSLNSQLASDLEARAAGRDWPATAETMIGLLRLENLQYCISEIVRAEVPGDLIETGVWRGGACIFMTAVLKVLGDTQRRFLHGTSEARSRRLSCGFR